MKKKILIISVSIFCLSQPLLLAWKKLEGFVDGPNYNNPDQNLILYTNAYRLNEINLPFLFDHRGPGPSNITLSNEVLSLQFDLFEKNDVIRTNISYENIPKEFLDKIADKSIFFRLGYNGNIYAVDNDSKKIIFTTKTNEFIRSWTEIPQSYLVAYTIFDNISTNKESKFLLKISNIDGDQVTNVINKTIDNLPRGASYWIGDNIFIPSQGRIGATPIIYNIQSNKILFSDTYGGYPRLINNQIIIYDYPEQKNGNNVSWTETSVWTNHTSTEFIEKLAAINEVNKQSSKPVSKTLAPTSNSSQVKVDTEPSSIPEEKLYFGVTKRNLLSALMMAGGGALLVMTLLYAFWPRQK